MQWQHTSYTLALILSTAVSAGIAGFVFRKRSTSGAIPFVGLMFALATWSLCYAFETANVTFVGKLFWSNAAYVGIVAVPACWLLFTIQYAGGVKGPRKYGLLLLVIEPVIVLYLLWSGDSQGLLRRSFALETTGHFVVLAKSYGPAFWVHAAYSYVLLLTGTFLLLVVIARSPFIYAQQVGTVLASLSAPWLANAIYISGFSPFPHLDLTPFAFIFLGVAVALSLFRLQFLDIVPIARNSIVEDLGDCVIVLNARDQIVDVNAAATAIIDRPDEDLIGAKAAEVFTAMPGLVNLLDSPVEVTEEVALGQKEDRRYFEVKLQPISDRRGRLTGRLISLHNITSRKRFEEQQVQTQRLRAIGELSAGVSHNLNNMLTAIMGPAELIKMDADDEQVRKHADMIIAATLRASNLIQRLSETVLQRSDGVDLQPVNICETVEKAVQSAQPRWKDQAESEGIAIRISTQFYDAPPVAATSQGLHDALLDMIFNAVEAMPEGGGKSPSPSCREVKGFS
jgi:PAS domain S-box-containing protein